MAELTGQPLTAVNLSDDQQAKLQGLWQKEINPLWDFINDCQQRIIQK